jgi:hypothetical protein
MLIAIQILTQMFGKNKHEAVASYPEVWQSLRYDTLTHQRIMLTVDL